MPDRPRITTQDLPQDRPLTDAEIAIYVATAILDNRFNPGSDEPFQPAWQVLLRRLGIGRGEDRPAIQAFLEANKERHGGMRLAEFCWRMVGLGFLVPQTSNDWGLFHPTRAGREFFENLDSNAIVQGGLDKALDEIGLAVGDVPRIYARHAQDCFLAGHYESAAVMLGVATESLVGSLVDSVEASRTSLGLGLPKLPSPRRAASELRWLSESLREHRSGIRRALPTADVWLDELTNVLDGTGQAIRLTRNEAGHPTGITVTQADVLQLIALFPRFTRSAMQAREAFAAPSSKE